MSQIALPYRGGMSRVRQFGWVSNRCTVLSTLAQLPNQAVLINSVPLLKAQTSSEIENIVTTSDALFSFH